MNLNPTFTLTFDFGRGMAEWHIGVSLLSGDQDIRSVMAAQVASSAGKELVHELTDPELARIRDAVSAYLPQ